MTERYGVNYRGNPGQNAGGPYGAGYEETAYEAGYAEAQRNMMQRITGRISRRSRPSARQESSNWERPF